MNDHYTQAALTIAVAILLWNFKTLLTVRANQIAVMTKIEDLPTLVREIERRLTVVEQVVKDLPCKFKPHCEEKEATL